MENYYFFLWFILNVWQRLPGDTEVVTPQISKQINGSCPLCSCIFEIGKIPLSNLSH